MPSPLLGFPRRGGSLPERWSEHVWLQWVSQCSYPVPGLPLEAMAYPVLFCHSAPKPQSATRPTRPLTSPQAKGSPEFPICIWGIMAFLDHLLGAQSQEIKCCSTQQRQCAFVSGVQGDPPGQMLVVQGEECLPAGPCWCRAAPCPFSSPSPFPVLRHNARPHFLEPAIRSLTLRLPTFIFPRAPHSHPWPN